MQEKIYLVLLLIFHAHAQLDLLMAKSSYEAQPEKQAPPRQRKTTNTDTDKIGVWIKHPGQLHFDNSQIGENDDGDLVVSTDVTVPNLITTGTVDGVDVSDLDASVVKTTGDQTIAGNKNFDGNVLLDESSTFSIGNATLSFSDLTSLLALLGNGVSSAFDVTTAVLLEASSSCSSEYSGTYPCWNLWNIDDGDDTDYTSGWVSLNYLYSTTDGTYAGSVASLAGTGRNGEWNQIDLGGTCPYTISSYILIPRVNAPLPEEWELLVSDDGSTWTVADSRTDQFLDPPVETTYTLDTPVVGRYVALQVSRNGFSTGYSSSERETHVSIGGLELY